MMKKILNGRQFLAVDKANFNQGLKSVDLMILSQVEEFQRNKCKCYMTNKQLSEAFGESESTIKRSIAKLEEMNVISKETSFIKGNGKGTRQRVLHVNDRSKWTIASNSGIEMEGSNFTLEGSVSENGESKSDERKVHNEPIKENIKDNEKDKIKDKNMSVPSNEGDFVGLLQKIGITYSKNTKEQLEQIIKEDLDFEILKKLINENQSTWNRYRDKTEQYRYGTLKHIVQKDYVKTKKKITALRSQYVTDITQIQYPTTKIDYKALEHRANESRKANEEGLSTEDLLQFLDDWNEEEPTHESSKSDENGGECESLQLLRKLMEMKDDDELDIFDAS